MRSPFSRSKSSEPSEEAAPERRKKRTTQDMLEENSGPGIVVTTLRTLVGFAIAAVLLVGLYFGASALEGDKQEPTAPWNAQGAPDVKPATLVDQ